MGIIRQTYDDGTQTKLNKLRFSEYDQRPPIITKEVPYKGDSIAPTVNTFTRRADDFLRIATILTQPPGLRYLGHETALNIPKVDFKTKHRKDGSTSILGTLANGLLANLLNTAKIIGSTLLQVPLNGTGTHFVKGFDGVGKRVYLENIQTAPHKLALFTGNVFADNVIPPGYSDDPRTPERETKEDNFMAVSTMPDSTYTVFHPSEVQLVPRYNITASANKETRLGLGDPGRRTERATYDTLEGKFKGLLSDAKNLTPPLPSSNPEFEAPNGANDIIKFSFEVITPRNQTMLYFRAFLDSFSDSYSANWTPINYIGRGESFYTYDNSTRSINLAFKISAQSRDEMRPLYQKISYLASSTSPSYTTAGFQTPTFVNVTVGDYLDAVPCIINTCTYTWNQDYQWEIAMDKGDYGRDFDQQELPQILDCQLTITPLHTFLPQTGYVPFIGSRDGYPKGHMSITEDGSPGKSIPQPERRIILDEVVVTAKRKT
jgi:hypothetical protein